ncbi:MAG: dTMP kinase [Desulfatiglandaceae bacterium]
MFITFEGIEGCGKSTQAERLVARLRKKKVPLVFTLEPGGTRVGKEIRRILLDPKNQHLTPFAELLLYAADRAQHVEEVIRPALDQRKWVLCDRYFDATTVYQGYVRGQDMSLVGILNEKATRGIFPDLTFLLDCEVEIALGRAIRRTETRFQAGQDRFEREKADFHEAVRQGYLSLARDNPERFVVVDGKLAEDELEAIIFQNVAPFVSKQSGLGVT